MPRKLLPIIDTPIPGRLCWECARIFYLNSSPGYSEYTPGEDATLSCSIGYWEVNWGRDSLQDFRDKIHTAERCADFINREEGT